MTNEEKIRELSRKHQGTMTDAQYLQMMYAIEEMAEWKDDKFYMILACIKYSLEKSKVNGVDEFVNNLKKEWEE